MKTYQCYIIVIYIACITVYIIVRELQTERKKKIKIKELIDSPVDSTPAAPHTIPPTQSLSKALLGNDKPRKREREREAHEKRRPRTSSSQSPRELVTHNHCLSFGQTSHTRNCITHILKWEGNSGRPRNRYTHIQEYIAEQRRRHFYYTSARRLYNTTSTYPEAGRARGLRRHTLNCVHFISNLTLRRSTSLSSSCSFTSLINTLHTRTLSLSLFLSRRTCTAALCRARGPARD